MLIVNCCSPLKFFCSGWVRQQSKQSEITAHQLQFAHQDPMPQITKQVRAMDKKSSNDMAKHVESFTIQNVATKIYMMFGLLIHVFKRTV